MSLLLLSPFIGNVASTEVTEVTEPYEIYDVDETNDDKRQLIKFAAQRIPCYNPRAGYGYYEFTVPAYVLPERIVMALDEVNVHYDVSY